MIPELKNLIRLHQGKILPFKDLPGPAQAAMAWYMSIDGEAWDYNPNLKDTFADTQRKQFNLGKKLTKNLDFYIENYGAEKFGLVEIPTQEIITLLQKNPHVSESFDGKFPAYHSWYLEACGNYHQIKENTARWPTILSDNKKEHEIFQDGWHRFHRYVFLQHSTIPCLWYPKS